MLDLRSNQPEKKPNSANSSIPTVGALDDSEPIKARKPLGRRPELKSTNTIVKQRSADSIALYAAIIAVVIAFGAGALALFFAGNERNQAEQSRSEFSSLQSQLNSQPIIGQLSRIRKVSRQLEVLNTVDIGATPWPDLIDVFAGLIPGAVSLTSSNYDSETNLLTIEGEAANNYELGNLIKSLDVNNRFNQPLVLASTLSESPDRTVVNFSVSAAYVPTTQSLNNLDVSTDNQTGVTNGQ